MKSLSYILIFLTSCGCASYKNTPLNKLSGTYNWQGLYGVGETLIVNQDSTFNFTWSQGLMNGKTDGFVEIRNRKINLHSYNQPDSVNYELEILPQIEQEHFKIWVVDMDLEPLIGALCKMFKNSKSLGGCVTNEFGVCELNITEADEIVIQYIGFKEARVKIENHTPKSLMIKLKEGGYEQYFQGTKLNRIGKNKIRLNSFNRVKVFKRIGNKD